MNDFKKERVLRTILIHISVILVFVLYDLPAYLINSPRTPIIKMVFYSLSCVAYYYVVRYGQLPLLKRKKWTFFWSLTLLGSLTIFNILSISLSELGNLILDRPFFPVNGTIILFTTIRGTYIIFLALLFYFIYLHLAKERKAAKIEQAFLRSQINQHLLFNFLNYHYVHLRDVAPHLSEGVMMFTDMLRYALSQSREVDQVPITQEVEQLSRLIHTYQLLEDNDIHIDFTSSLTGAYKDVTIPALLLVNILDNVFKHGDLHNPDRLAIVRLNVSTKEIYFRTENSKRRSPSLHSMHIGMENTRERLTRAYAGNFSLDIKDRSSFYILELLIKL